MMNISFLVGAALMVLVVYIDPLTGADIFGTVAISWEDWLISMACAIGIIPIVELQKAIERKVEENKNKNQKTLSDEEILIELDEEFDKKMIETYSNGLGLDEKQSKRKVKKSA